MNPFKKAIKESQDYYENFITRSVHSSNKIEVVLCQEKGLLK